MSQTERTRRFVQTATLDDLRTAHRELLRDLAGTTNPMVRSSVKAQLATVAAELDRRAS